MAVPIWVAKYIGLPFREHGRDRKGLDCWGLVRLVMAEQFFIGMPSYSNQYAGTVAKRDCEDIGCLIRAETGKQWKEVPRGREHIGDAIVLRINGQPMHVGIVAGDRYMLHIERGIDSCIEPYTGMRWKDRVYGFYKYGEI